AVALGFALVVILLALAQTDENLGAPLVVEEQLERHNGIAGAGDFLIELGELLFRYQEFTRAALFMIEAVGLQIFGDMGVDQPEFATLWRGVGFGDLRLAQTQGFD